MAQSNFVIYAMPNDNSMHSHDRLLHCASLYSGLPPSAFCREQQPNGKPVLKGGPDLHFSVSHSGKWWVCAFGPQEVGLDVQKNRPCRAQALAKRFFHPDEAAYLQSKDFSLQEFYRLWTAKESYVKLSGRGFGKGFSTFSLIPQPVGPQWRYLSLEQNYTLCLCAEQIDQVVIKHLTINDGGTLF